MFCTNPSTGQLLPWYVVTLPATLLCGAVFTCLAGPFEKEVKGLVSTVCTLHVIIEMIIEITYSSTQIQSTCIKR